MAPSDWKEQAAGRNGGDRFRYRNLPSPHAGAGIYELGITLPAWKTEDLLTETGSLKSEDIIIVYVGHADHIRNRLQRYGQAGAHLEGLRSDIATQFCNGFSPGVCVCTCARVIEWSLISNGPFASCYRGIRFGVHLQIPELLEFFHTISVPEFVDTKQELEDQFCTR